MKTRKRSYIDFPDISSSSSSNSQELIKAFGKRRIRRRRTRKRRLPSTMSFVITEEDIPTKDEFYTTYLSNLLEMCKEEYQISDEEDFWKRFAESLNPKLQKTGFDSVTDNFCRQLFHYIQSFYNTCKDPDTMHIFRAVRKHLLKMGILFKNACEAYGHLFTVNAVPESPELAPQQTQTVTTQTLLQSDTFLYDGDLETKAYMALRDLYKDEMVTPTDVPIVEAILTKSKWAMSMFVECGDNESRKKFVISLMNDDEKKRKRKY